MNEDVERQRLLAHGEEGLFRMTARLEDEKKNASVSSLRETDGIIWGQHFGPPAIPWYHSPTDLASLGKELEDRGAIPRDWAMSFSSHFTVDDGSIIDAANLRRLLSQRKKKTSKVKNYYSASDTESVIQDAIGIIRDAAVGIEDSTAKARLQVAERRLQGLLSLLKPVAKR